MNINNFREDILGIDMKVMTLNGEKPYIFFDNGASTPGFKSVFKKLEEFMHFYSNVHRGSGYKSYFATEAYEEARKIVKDFLDADDNHTVVFIKNSTEGINKLARKLKDYIGKGKVIITDMEHHSNILPWMKNYETILWETEENGKLSLSKLEELLLENNDVKLVAVTGASNVTGFTNKIHEIAKISHSYGAKIFVDGAQLVPHKKVSMRGKNKDERIDFLVFSAHKIYAPYGSGALIGDTEILSHGDPESVGGGTVKFVSFERVIWADLPDKEEAGTPNIPGAIALALTLKKLNEFGMEKLEEHEEELSRYFMEKFKGLKNFKLVGEDRGQEAVSVFSFIHRKFSPFLVSSYLSYESAIGVRAGCFCAHPYMLKMIGIFGEKLKETMNNVILKRINYIPGAVRASLGCYNTKEEIDKLFDTLYKIDEMSEIKGYKFNPDIGNYVPEGFSFGEIDFFK